MTETRIKIDLTHGLLEAEGSEPFVKSIYDDFKERIQSGHTKISGMATGTTTSTMQSDQSVSITKSRKRKVGNTPALAKDLDLTGGEIHKSLRKFVEQYAPANNMENNLIFAYYLQHEINFSPIHVDHIFTCYREVVLLHWTGLRQS